MSRIVRRAVIAGVLASTVSLLAIADSTSASPSAPAPTSAATYTVRAGDTLIRIAQRSGTRLADLLAANGMTVTSLIVPGMVLDLPAGAIVPAARPASPAPAPSATPTASYTVVPGDSLIRIARRHGVALNALLSTNGLTTSSLIWPGMQLTLPAGATPPSTPNASPTTTPAANPAPTAAPAASGVSYTVVAGDTLGRIAQSNGVRLADLLALNGITATSLILPGRVLQLPVAATPAPTVAPVAAPTPASAPATGNAQLDGVLAFAAAQVGKPYKFFSAGPDTFDCSGLTRAAYLQAGLSLPHQSGAQSQLGTAVDWTTAAIQPGDLVFLTRDGLESSPISHVGIATSATTWIHATRPGDVVRSGTIPVWRIVEVRRFLGA